MSEFHPLRIASVAQETRDAVVVTFEVPDEHRDAFRYAPGQHLILRTEVGGEEVRRSYSICSAPHEGHVRVAIKRVAGGVFSTWAHEELRAGHVIDCMTPAGRFGASLGPADGRHHVAFAAGSGITPILSMLKAVLNQEPHSRFTLVYGNRASSSVLFKEELENLKDEHLGRLNLVFILSREQQDVELFHGRIDRAKCDQLLKRWIDPNDIDVAYLCGPQTMMEEVAASLQAHGVDKERVHRELFGTSASSARRAPAPAVAKEQECRVTVMQDGHAREFRMKRNARTVLDSALEQGLELPYSCKGGVCSSCRCKMTKGEVEMDVNFALEDYEVARGFILTCQSYPLTEEIVLDFDQET